MTSRNAWVKLILAISLWVPAATSLFGCAGKEIDENDPAALYSDAESDITNDHFQVAVDKLRTIKNKFPYSKYSVDASLRIADVQFLQDSWAEAAISYEAFVDLHPRHERVPYALFRIAKSYYNDIPNPIARDMTPGQKAVDAYSDFLRRFPNDPQAPEARKDVAEVRSKLAEKELSIGDFYQKRSASDSAAPRYRKVIELYPETDAARKARERLERIAGKSGKDES